MELYDKNSLWLDNLGCLNETPIDTRSMLTSGTKVFVALNLLDWIYARLPNSLVESLLG